MKPTRPSNESGATGYILLWLLGIPLPFFSLSFFCGAAPKSGKASVGNPLAATGAAIVDLRRFTRRPHVLLAESFETSGSK
jgi:hypothetical protein